jgi:Fe-S-cluster containining protein
LGLLRERLGALYEELDAAVAALGPVCAVSGRCCRFAEYGHTLFLSEPEAALLLSDAPPPVRPLDEGATCPWQDGQNRCTARGARPLGCRVFFCDPAFEPHAEALSEAFIARLKRLADGLGRPWHYAPLHRHLERARDEGRFTPPTHGPA